MRRAALAACALFALMTGPAAAGRLRTFDLPGQSAICGAASADDGTVVGNSLPALGSGDAPVNFIYAQGAFTVLSLPFTTGFTAVSGVNRAGKFVGTNTVFGKNFSETITGFAVKNGVLRLVHIPGAAEVTVRGISDGDVIVGSYQTSSSAPTLGFIKRGNIVTTLNDGSGEVLPAASDSDGTRVVGTSMPAGDINSWLWQGGKFTPIAVPGALATFARGINRAGTVSGTYLTGSATAPVNHGFLLNGGTFSYYDVPGATGTEFSGINARGEATGCYSDSAGTHGLIYKP